MAFCCHEKPNGECVLPALLPCSPDCDKLTPYCADCGNCCTDCSVSCPDCSNYCKVFSDKVGSGCNCVFGSIAGVITAIAVIIFGGIEKCCESTGKGINNSCTFCRKGIVGFYNSDFCCCPKLVLECVRPMWMFIHSILKGSNSQINIASTK